MRKLAILFVLLALLTVGSATAQEGSPFPSVDILTMEVLAEHPHDPTAFTQGLLWHDGLLYESTGRRGQSTLRAVDLQTGEVLRRFDVPEEIFAEGLALVDGRLYQLTWQAQAALVYNLEPAEGGEDTFEPLGVYQYTGEGWGLCYDGESLYMSNGSDTVTVRDPETFQGTRSFRVTLYGAFVDEINELECVGDHIYANVWQSDTILRMDKQTGIVDAVINGAGLLDPETRAGLEGAAVLNGIAYNPDTETFLVTGKLWPSLFEVRFVPAGE